MRRKSKPKIFNPKRKDTARGFADRSASGSKLRSQPTIKQSGHPDTESIKPIQRISLCMIVKNEAERLEQCLASVQGLVDEIVLVDTGSTDETIEIAKGFSAKIFHYDWHDHFAAARNYSLQQAQGDWILVLDADEVINPEAIAAITNQIRQQIKAKNCLAINLVRLEVGANQTPYSLVSRLFRRHQEISFKGIYHELIDDSVNEILQREPGWQIATIEHPIAIYHYGYQVEQIDRKRKHQFAQRLMQKHLATYPHDSYMYSKLGALLVENGDLEAGLTTLKTGLSKADEHHAPPQIWFELYFHLAIVHSEQTNLPGAIDYYQQAISQSVPNLVKLPAYNNLGNLFQQQEQFELAHSQYEQVTQIAPNFAKGFYNLGIALRHLRQLDRAVAAYQQAIAIEPRYAQAHQNLGVALLKIGQPAEAIESLQRAIELHYEQGNGAIARELETTLKQMGLV
nr:tetratricopeptide repeat protein [Pseudanabaena sp. PCC 7367]